MSVIAEFTIPAEAFAIDRAFETGPAVTIEVERLATHSREWVMPFLRVSADDPESATAELREDPCVEDSTGLDVVEEASCANGQRNEDVRRFVGQIVNKHGIVHEAEASGETNSMRDRRCATAFASRHGSDSSNRRPGRASRCTTATALPGRRSHRRGTMPRFPETAPSRSTTPSPHPVEYRRSAGRLPASSDGVQLPGWTVNVRR